MWRFVCAASARPWPHRATAAGCHFASHRQTIFTGAHSSEESLRARFLSLSDWALLVRGRFVSGVPRRHPVSQLNVFTQSFTCSAAFHRSSSWLPCLSFLPILPFFLLSGLLFRFPASCLPFFISSILPSHPSFLHFFLLSPTFPDLFVFSFLVPLPPFSSVSHRGSRSPVMSHKCFHCRP